MLHFRTTILTSLILFLGTHFCAFGQVNDKLPPAIQSVKGDCRGRIAITPSNKQGTTALIYHCKDRRFEAVKLKQSGGDLTLVPGGYYISQNQQSDVLIQGKYTIFRSDGSEKFSLSRNDLDVHDIIFEDDSVTYLKYVPDRKHSSCFGQDPNSHLEIVQEDFAGKIIWAWSSEGYFGKNYASYSNGSQFLGLEVPWKTVFRPIRNCYTSLLLKLVDFHTPALFLPVGDGFPLLEIETNDYIHANSLQRLPSGDLLVSARHLDTVFIIDKKTGKIKWSLGGKYSKFAALQPVDDPLEGFSHQHSATIDGSILWVFDNGNRFERPSRVVAYHLGSQMQYAKYQFSFTEPNGKRRRALGNVQVVSKNEVIVGWGGVSPTDIAAPQRGVSIIDIPSHRETFVIDFAPGYSSYRAKWAP